MVVNKGNRSKHASSKQTKATKRLRAPHVAPILEPEEFEDEDFDRPDLERELGQIEYREDR